MRRCGAILLETMLALAIFVMAGLAIGGSMRLGMASMSAARDQARALDLARSALARIEAGLETPLSLNGPVKPWVAAPDAWEGDAFEDELSEAVLAEEDPDSGWELEIETSPSEFEGLSTVRVRAVRYDTENPDVELVSVTLVQLVELRETGSDAAGQESDLARTARDGARSEERREFGRSREGGR